MATNSNIFKGPLSPRVHGYFDYGAAALLFLAPSLFDFSGTPAWLSYLAAFALLGVSVLTAYPLGLLKLIPFPTHGVIEAAAAVALIISPWLFGFSEFDSARNFFVAVGIAVIGLFAATNYLAAERPKRAAVRRRAQV